VEILLVATPIALMCVLISAYAKELALIPVLMVIAFPSSDPIEVAFIGFVITSVFKIVVGLAYHKGGA
jgi:hypothetical protein